MRRLALVSARAEPPISSAEVKTGSAAEDAYKRCAWSRDACTTTFTVTAPVD